MSDHFLFTVTDLGRFLGKHPATIRGWERQKLIELPRLGTDRKLTPEDVRWAARSARELGRITERRLRIVESTVTLLSLIEGDKK